jgi:hypothetical protein
VGAAGAPPLPPQAAVPTAADINIANKNFCIDDPPGVHRTVPAHPEHLSNAGA